MKPNPKNFEAFIDPNGGEWIRIKQGKFRDVVWRPAEMELTEGDQLTFQAEFLGEAPNDIEHFQKIAGSIINDIMVGMANEDSNSNSSKT